MTRARVPLLIGLLLLAPRAAYADFFVVPFLGMKFGGSTSIVDFESAAGNKKLVLGIAARKVDDGILGYEAEFGNIAGYFSNEMVLGATASSSALGISLVIGVTWVPFLRP